MGEALRRRLLQVRFQGPHHEAALSVHLAAAALRDALGHAFADDDLTPGQYNVLRILNGVHPGGHARGEIARRMMDRAPDLTRMIDRLVRRGLAERYRSEQDSRRSMTRITPKGRRLLRRLQPRVREQEDALRAKLSAREARTLTRLLERLFDDPA